MSAATIYFLAHLLCVQGSNNCCDPHPHATPQYLISDWEFRLFAFIAGKQLKQGSEEQSRSYNAFAHIK